ncbi:unnamed protein product [Tenebrio molitor]|nr:unnamed protein product [Tenebrio molitor]
MNLVGFRRRNIRKKVSLDKKLCISASNDDRRSARNARIHNRQIKTTALPQ